VFALTVFVLVIELVRRRELGEDFSWAWLLGGAALVAAASTEQVFVWLGRLTGIVEPTSIVFFFGIAFLMFVCLQLSVKLSENRTRIKNLSQQLAQQRLLLERLDAERSQPHSPRQGG
jgi:hypothetical protein